LKFDPGNPASKVPLTTYTPATIRASSYPNLLNQDLITISVGAYLVTYDYNLRDIVSRLARFGRSLCANFATLQAQGHPKWREVDLTLPKLNPGWVYYPETTREIRNCTAAQTKAAAKPVKVCTSDEKILGLCK